VSYFIYTYTIDSLLDPKLVDPGSTLIHVVHTTLRAVCTNLDRGST